MSADLHCHTRLSDGSTDVGELVQLAKGSGLSAIALTDHDTFAGVSKAISLGNEIGLEVIPGAEISCYDNKRKGLFIFSATTLTFPKALMIYFLKSPKVAIVREEHHLKDNEAVPDY